jgi:hypothetical protein
MNFNFFGFGKKETKIEEKLSCVDFVPGVFRRPHPEEEPEENEKNLEVLRYSSGADSTLGLLFINSVPLDIYSSIQFPWGREFLAYTLEDEFREKKVSAETRIPEGKYEVGLRATGGFNSRYLNKFGADFHKGMLHVQDVPGFEYILIHTGNTDENTMGCLLVADTSQQNITKDGFIGASVDAYKRIYPDLAQWIIDGNKLTITYIDYDNPRN